MIRQITMNLDDKQQRPVIILENGLTALLDTGAYVPVWVDDESILTENLGAEFVKGNVPLSGFGGIAKGNMYRATFQIGDLIFPNMHIIANGELISPFNLIFSSTMLRNLIYEIDDKNHKLTITVPEGESMVRGIRIEDSEGRLHVLCDSISDDEVDRK